MQIYWTKIDHIVEEAPNTKTFMLETPADFIWEEGAHTHFALEGFNSGEKPNKSLVRHMSISTLPKENKVGITTRIRENRSDFKNQLNNLSTGSSVALFKTGTNMPLKRENKSIYLLSSGVGIATFRPVILEYLADIEGVEKVHSLNVDSSRNFLFPDLFASSVRDNFTADFVDNRRTYYQKVQEFSQDRNSLFYVVGSDEFLKENIHVLRQQGIHDSQILLDKHEKRISEFFIS